MSFPLECILFDIYRTMYIEHYSRVGQVCQQRQCRTAALPLCTQAGKRIECMI